MRVTVIEIPGMDCPSEERMLRNAFADSDGIVRLDFDMASRRMRVTHVSPVDSVVTRAASVGLGAVLVGSEESGAAGTAQPAKAAAETRILGWALAINATMFIVEMTAGLIWHSAGLVSDSLDMFADASVYALSLFAVGRSTRLKLRAAHLSGRQAGSSRRATYS